MRLLLELKKALIYPNCHYLFLGKSSIIDAWKGPITSLRETVQCCIKQNLDCVFMSQVNESFGRKELKNFFFMSDVRYYLDWQVLGLLNFGVIDSTRVALVVARILIRK